MNQEHYNRQVQWFSPVCSKPDEPWLKFFALPFNTWSLPVKRWQPFLEGSFWLSFSLYSQLLIAAEQNHQGLIQQPLLQLPPVLWFQNGKTDNVTGSMLQSVLFSKLQIQITKQNILSLLNVITQENKLKLEVLSLAVY